MPDCIPILILLLGTGPVAAGDDPVVEASVRIYREPEDPLARRLADAATLLGAWEGITDTTRRQAFSDPITEKDAHRILKDLDRAIADRPTDPWPRWLRGLTLTALKRTAEARAAREETIRLTRLWPGGEDTLATLYAAHAESCVAEGDIPAAAAAFLAQLDLEVDSERRFYFLARAVREPFKGPRFAPGPGPNFQDAARLEKEWGPLAKFFEDHAGPTDAASLARAGERVRVGMDYREVARRVGFPWIGLCEWDHGVPEKDVCWEYNIQAPTIVRDGDFVVAVPPKNPKRLHVVMLDGRVRKVETTQGDPPDNQEYPHGERLSFAYDRNSIEAVAISPDGALVAGGDIRGGVHLREVRDGRARATLRVPGVGEGDDTAPFRSVAFAPGGKFLAAAGLYDKTARLWDIESGKLHATLKAVPGPVVKGDMDCVESIAFSSDGKTLATAGYSPEVRLWDVATGRLLAILQGHPGQAKSVAFSPDGKTLATGGEDGSVVLWDVSAARPRSRIPGYEIPVSALAFSPDGRTLAVGRSNGWTGTVRLRDLAGERWRATLRVGFGYDMNLAFSPDGRTLAVANGSRRVVILCDVATGRRSGLLEGHAKEVESVAFSPDGRTIATGGPDGLKIWDAPRSADRVEPLKP